jgi:hypothetical protein
MVRVRGSENPYQNVTDPEHLLQIACQKILFNYLPLNSTGNNLLKFRVGSNILNEGLIEDPNIKFLQLHYAKM